MKHMLLLLLCMAVIPFCQGQKILRQSIGTIGASYSQDGMTLQQSIGQPYQRPSATSEHSIALPGFIQPAWQVEDLFAPPLLQKIEVFPNPVSEFLQFRAAGLSGEVQLEVWTESGALLRRELISDLSSYRLSSLDWQQGLYLLRISTPGGASYQTKILKSR